jgi:hypothetical protein
LLAVRHADKFVNEVYLRLIDAQQVNWQNRTHFFSLAASLMRRILVEMAREKQARQRGGSLEQIELAEKLLAPPVATKILRQWTKR